MASIPTAPNGSTPDPRAVFIVHGRNETAHDSLVRFLHSIGLRQIEWSDAVRMTGKASPFTGDILEAGLSAAQAVIVLLTGDDVARVRRPYGVEPLTPQPRANVLFEAGMALGRFPERTIFVQIGQSREFSDIAGRHLIKLDSDTKSAQQLVECLKAARCQVQDDAHAASFQYTTPDSGRDGTFEITRKVLYTCLTLAVCVLAFCIKLMTDGAEPPQITVVGEIRSARHRQVVLYFVGPQHTRSGLGRFSATIRLPDDVRKALYVVGGEVLKDEDFQVVGNKVQLDAFDDQIREAGINMPSSVKPMVEADDEETRKFLRGN